MQVTTELIQKLADLSQLEFAEGEMEHIKLDLQKMISFVEKLNELDLDDTAPLLQVGEAGNVMRDDETGGQLQKEEALRNAPANDGSFFKVPRVVNKR